MSTKRHDNLSIAPGAPVTASRPILTDDLDQYIDKPHIPRAFLAVDKEHPNGSAGHEHSGMSVMQQHVAYFDRNNDGVVYPWETYAGFRAIGFNVLWSFGGMVFINGAFSYVTLGGWIPSLTFPIYVKNIHKAKHGSDSEVYDAEGRFLPTKFEELFTKFDKEQKGGLNWEDLNVMVHAMANASDPFGWTAMRLEWGLTWLLLKDENGLVSKEKIRGMYDASIFERIEAEITAKKGEAQAKKIK